MDRVRHRATGSAVDARLAELIAADDPAQRHGATVLACDADIDRVARVVGIELDDASLRAT